MSDIHTILRFILLPFSLLYGLITDVRNFLYDKNIFQVTVFDKVIINVGNLTVGGTGKSPHVEYLIRLLYPKFHLVSLSRGYGRKTKGFIIADQSATAESIGDEPMQFHQKFQNEVQVTVGEKRAEALTNIYEKLPFTDIVILDDAFQHRAVKASLNIVLMDFSRPIYEDFTFPAGRLRERRHGAKRADILIVTKCPNDLSKTEQEQIQYQLKPYLKATTPIFFTGIQYSTPKPLFENTNTTFSNTLLLVSGIANPKPFEAYCRKQFSVIKHLTFKDHHLFTEKDIAEMVDTFKHIQNQEKGILMTEKDMVKFKKFIKHEALQEIPLFYLPIEIYFLNQAQQQFNDLILQHISIASNR